MFGKRKENAIHNVFLCVSTPDVIKNHKYLEN